MNGNTPTRKHEIITAAKPIPAIPFQRTTLAFHPLGGIGKVSRMEDGIL